MNKLYKLYKNNKTARQTLLLFSAQIFSLGIGFIANMLLAKEMGAQQFGIYSFALATISFVAIFFEFGYFASGARLLAQNNDKVYEKELIAALLVIAGIIAIGFVITIFCLSLVVDYIFEDQIGDILRIASVVSFSFILPFFMELVLKGSNHIEYLSLFHFVWKVLFIVAIITLWAIKQLTPLYTLFFLSGSAILAFLLIVIYLKPKFYLLHQTITEIHAENIRYGIHLYFGRVVDVSTYQLDRLMIAFFVNATEVGFYSLALAMASPLQTFTNSLASSKFKSFVDKKIISQKLLLINYIWIGVGGLSALVFGYFIVYYILGVEYHDVFLLLVLLIIAVAFQSGYQAYNAWLASNGEGVYMKRKSFYTAFANIVLNIVLIPIWGAVGAAIASIISMAISYWLHIFYYRKSLLKGSVSV
jgi:O-antigen/teichoic acid export membrane protein